VHTSDAMTLDFPFNEDVKLFQLWELNNL